MNGGEKMHIWIVPYTRTNAFGFGFIYRNKFLKISLFFIEIWVVGSGK